MTRHTSLETVHALFDSDPVSCKKKTLRDILLMKLIEHVRHAKWNETDINSNLGITKHHAYELLQGDSTNFSIELLTTLLFRAGYNIEVNIKKKH